MDAHPVPQNVTAFQFKLVGDMTLKQFMYLASGLGFAYLLFIIFGAKIPFFVWPIIISLVLLGVAFAFLPFADRPLDHWVLAFFHSVYSPTQRVWRKNGKTFQDDPSFATRFQILLNTRFPPPPPPQMLPNQPPILYTPPPAPSPQPRLDRGQPAEAQKQTTELPTQEELGKTVELAKKAQTLQKQIVESEKKITTLASTSTQTPDTNVQINQVLDDLQGLIAQALDVKKELAQLTSEGQPQTLLAQNEVKIVTPTKQSLVSLTSFPNVINGVITDSERNFLEGVVVVIYDKDGLPVRALKTNKLGQFSGATPLPNGTYIVELEKENLVFDRLQLDLNGKILPPLQVAAKKLTGVNQ